MPEPADAIQNEVIHNIESQPFARDANGQVVATVAALALPKPFVGRVADRIVRESFEMRSRAILENRPPQARRAPQAPASPQGVAPDAWPDQRGFRMTSAASTPQPLPGVGAEREAATIIATRLAADGLPRTLVDALLVLNPGRFSRDEAVAVLDRCGLPVDLLDVFRSSDGSPLLDAAISAVTSGASADALNSLATNARFEFTPAVPGFIPHDDSGADAIDCFRMHLTRPNHWDGDGGGPGSGDNVDLLHAIAEKSGCYVSVAVHAGMADAARASMASWSESARARVSLQPIDAVVSQWAQDLGRAGSVGGAPVMLVPRYPSRSEVGAKVAGSDAAAAWALQDAGIRVVASRLHFQGGDTLVVDHESVGGGGGQLLLVGEAIVYRNVALGLTAVQTLEALRIEFGASKVVMLPAVSFHLDYEVSLRSTPQGVIAFVSDEEAATRLILQAGIRALESAKVVSSADARVLRTFLESRNEGQFVLRMAATLAPYTDQIGALPASLAMAFSIGRADSGVGNLQRFTRAVDTIATLEERSWESQLHPMMRSYLGSIRRQTMDRAGLHATLKSLGMRVVPVPSTSWDSRANTTINGVHMKGAYLMPTSGGLYRSIDDAADRVFRANLPAGVKVAPIPTGESQRRGGAVRCSVAAVPCWKRPG